MGSAPAGSDVRTQQTTCGWSSIGRRRPGCGRHDRAWSPGRGRETPDLVPTGRGRQRTRDWLSRGAAGMSRGHGHLWSPGRVIGLHLVSYRLEESWSPQGVAAGDHLSRSGRPSPPVPPRRRSEGTGPDHGWRGLSPRGTRRSRARRGGIHADLPIGPSATCTGETGRAAPPRGASEPTGSPSGPPPVGAASLLSPGRHVRWGRADAGDRGEHIGSTAATSSLTCAGVRAHMPTGDQVGSHGGHASTGAPEAGGPAGSQPSVPLRVDCPLLARARMSPRAADSWARGSAPLSDWDIALTGRGHGTANWGSS